MEKHDFKFEGNGFGYFKIWIVNIFLSILTLGIYSPWAKVRNNAYLYGSTSLNGDHFEYTAQPIRILIGRLIVVGLYISYIIIADIMGLIEFASLFAIVIFLLVSWFIRQAIAFRMRYTRYRGINFSHRARIWDYYKFFIIHILLNLVTFFIALPYTIKEFKSLLINNTYYGKSKLNFQAPTSQFYMIVLKYFGISLLVAFLIFLGLAAIVGIVWVSNPEQINTITDLINSANQDNIIESEDAISLLVFGLMGIIYGAFFIFGSFLKGFWDAWMANAIYNNTTLEEFTPKSILDGLKLGWIYLSNFFLIIISLGLLYPYAKIRSIKYKLANISIKGESFDSFINQNLQETRALGEEAADFFDFDIGI